MAEQKMLNMVVEDQKEAENLHVTAAMTCHVGL